MAITCTPPTVTCVTMGTRTNVLKLQGLPLCKLNYHVSHVKRLWIVLGEFMTWVVEWIQHFVSWQQNAVQHNHTSSTRSITPYGNDRISPLLSITTVTVPCHKLLKFFCRITQLLAVIAVSHHKFLKYLQNLPRSVSVPSPQTGRENVLQNRDFPWKTAWCEWVVHAFTPLAIYELRTYHEGIHVWYSVLSFWMLHTEERDTVSVRHTSAKGAYVRYANEYWALYTCVYLASTAANLSKYFKTGSVWEEKWRQMQKRHFLAIWCSESCS